MLCGRDRGSLPAPLAVVVVAQPEDDMSRFFPALALLSLVALVTPAATALAHGDEHAEELVFNIHNLRYDVDGTGLGVVASPSTLHLLQGGGGITFFVADRPFALYDNRGEKPQLWSVLVQSMVGLDVHGAIGFGVADLGIHLPVIPVTIWGADPTGGDFPLPDSDSAGIGDLTLVPKVRIIDPAKRKFGLGVQLPVSFPTGINSPYLSEGGVSFAVDILAELRLKGFRALVNVAPLHLRPKVEYGGFVRQVGMNWKAGVALTALSRIEIRAEVWGSAAYQGEHSKTTAEWALSVALTPTEGVVLELGAGSGISGLGTPQLRAFGGVRFTSPDKRDKDGDGMVDSRDQCPTESEDFDDWNDDDGCPDPDNDGDGIPDTADACPLNAENMGVGDDQDGCPDLDQAPAEEQEAAPEEQEAAPEEQAQSPSEAQEAAAEGQGESSSEPDGDQEEGGD